MRLYRDVSGHPTAERMCETYSALRAEFLPPGSTRLGVMEYFTGARRSVVDVHLDAEGTTAIVFWPFFDHGVVSIKTVLSDGTLVETQMDPQHPKLVKRLMHRGDRRRAGLVEQHLTRASAEQTWRSHRALVEKLSRSGSDSPVRIRTMRAYCATVERMNEVADRSVLVGALVVTTLPLCATAVILSLKGDELNTATDWWWLVAVLVGSLVLLPIGGRIVARLPVWKRAPLADLLGEES